MVALIRVKQVFALLLGMFAALCLLPSTLAYADTGLMTAAIASAETQADSSVEVTWPAQLSKTYDGTALSITPSKVVYDGAEVSSLVTANEDSFDLGEQLCYVVQWGAVQDGGGVAWLNDRAIAWSQKKPSEIGDYKARLLFAKVKEDQITSDVLAEYVCDETFSITAAEKRNLAECKVEVPGTVDYRYGHEVKPDFVIRDAAGAELSPALRSGLEIRYEAVDGGDLVSAGTKAKVVVVANEGNEDFKPGTIEAIYEIVPASIQPATTPDLITWETSSGRPAHELPGALGASVYTGSAQTPDIPALCLLVNGTGWGAGYSQYDLTANDYTTEGWKKNVDVGTAECTLVGKGNFTGSLTLKWTIEPKSLGDNDVAVTGLDDQTWTGSEVTPPVPVVTWGDITLKKDVDYTVSYGDDLTGVGQVAVTIEGKGNYAGTVAGQFFRIGRSLEGAQVAVAGAGALAYTGEALEPAVTVTLDGEQLVAGQDYLVSYKDNVSAGTATVTVEGVDYYMGAATAAFEIAPAAQEITASDKAVTYGKTVNLGAKLAKGDGKLTYASSDAKVAKVDAGGKVTPVKAGTATITVTAAATANYAQATKTVKVTVKKAAQAIAFKAQKKTVKLAKVKKKAQTVAIAKAKGAKTAVKYGIAKVSKGKANFKINAKTGKITVKKGTKKGTYKVTVKATAKADAKYNAAKAKTAVVTITVK